MILIEAISILISTPGSLVYHLTLAMTLSLLFGLARTYHSKINSPSTTRWSRVAGGLLALRLAMMLIASLAWQLIIDGNLFLPPFDRFVSLVGIVVFAWAFLVPRPQRRSDLAVIGFLGAAVLGLIGTIFARAASDIPPYFNQVTADAYWSLAGLSIALIGAISVATRRPPQWNLALGGFILLSAGYGLHLTLSPLDNSLAGFVRWAELAAYPLFSLAALRSLTFEMPEPAETILPTHTELSSTKPGEPFDSLKELIDLFSAETPDDLAGVVVKSIAHHFPAEFCLMLSTPDPSDQILLLTGYDLNQEMHLPDVDLDSASCPTIMTALNRQRTLNLHAASRTPDLQILQKAFNLKTTGPALLVPLIGNGEPLRGILLLSPLQRKRWQAEDQRRLEEICHHLAFGFKQLKSPMTISDSESDGEGDPLSQSRSMIEALEMENARLVEQLQNRPLEYDSPQADDLAAWMQMNQEAQETIHFLEAEIERLKADALEPPSSNLFEEVELFSNDFQPPLEEQFGNGFSQAPSSTPKDVSTQSHDEETPEININADFAPELRQPMSTILGYTDLLLSGTAGELEDTQRKFLKRVRGGVNRMEAFLETPMDVFQTETSALNLTLGPIDLLHCVEDAVTLTSESFREKNLVLRMDFPDEIPPAIGDKEAVVQIIFHLLNNATLASPEGEEINIASQVQQGEGDEFLMLAISDAGEGILPDAMGQVFQHTGEANDFSIHGVGENGVGLSAVNALCEAMGGRVWFETRVGEGSTFTILLPRAHNTFQKTISTG